MKILEILDIQKSFDKFWNSLSKAEQKKRQKDLKKKEIEFKKFAYHD